MNEQVKGWEQKLLHVNKIVVSPLNFSSNVLHCQKLQQNEKVSVL